MRILPLLLLVPSLCLAQETVQTRNITEGSRIESLLNSAQSRATADLTERGSSIELTYSSPAELDVLILFMKDDVFNPLTALVTTLPKGTRKTARIDLTKSADWTPFTRTYRMHFLSRSAEGASFEDIEFIKPSPLTLLLATTKQLVTPLPYTPSSYHRLMSHRVLSVPIIPIVGMLIIVIGGYYVLTRKYKTAILVTVSITLLLNLRYAVDLAYFSVRHTAEWFGDSTYATAGALPQIATDLQQRGATGVHLCQSGTSYAEKLLAYHMYPILMEQKNPSHVVVHAADDWSFETGVLRCGKEEFRARKENEYTDGSIVFSARKL